MADSREQPEPTPPPRVLIALHAKGAAARLLDRIRRIYDSLGDRFDFAALVFAAEEATPASSMPMALDWLATPVTIGFGGIRKLAFEYALAGNFEAVVFPGEAGDDDSLGLLLAPLFAGEADTTALAPPAGLRERLAQRVVERIVRKPVGSLHAGARAYRSEALRRVPFALNANGRHIDMEILLQFEIAGLRAREIPASAAAVRGPAPAWPHMRDALRAAVRARLHQMNLFYERRFDCGGDETENAQYRLKMDFDSSHIRALARIPPGSRVLDLGCAGGAFAEVLEREHGCRVTAVDREPLAPGIRVEEFLLRDLDHGPPELDYGQYDVAIMLDVLEHLRAPERFLHDLHEKIAAHPRLKLVFTTGNVAFLTTRVGLMAGQFNYGKRGILDLTHTRLFTFSTFARLVRQAGFRILETDGVPAPFPLATTNQGLARGLLALNRALIAIVPSLTAYQMLFVLEPEPSLGFLLEEARARSTTQPLPTEPKSSPR